MYPFFIFLSIGLYIYFGEGYMLKKKKLDRDYKISKFIGAAYSIYAFGYLVYSILRR